jgi:homoserine dehydrogenase
MSPTSPAVCRAALLGFGTVGRAVARILTEQPPPRVRLTHVFNRNIAAKRIECLGPGVVWTDDIEQVFAAPVDLFVEVVGGLEPAGDWVTRALGSGRSVVTANKQLIAHRGPELVALARRNRCHLRYEASVAGGIPIIAALRDGLAGDRMTRVRGILNGTCNFILSSMAEKGASFPDALAEAQSLGFAEADPTDDVEGFDARAKLAILCASALRADVRPSEISTRAITSVDAVDFAHAHQLGCTIRQVSHAEWGEGSGGALHAAVRPALVPRESSIARASGSQNVIVLKGQYGGETVFSGSGAGGGPTSVAVVSDIAAIARQEPERETDARARRPASIDADFVTPHYLRFIVRDRPGIIAAIAGVTERHGINIDAVLQLPYATKDALPFVVTVEACPPSVLAQALAEIAAMDFHVQLPVDLPMLNGRSR